MLSVTRNGPSFLLLLLLYSASLAGCNDEPDTREERTVIVKKPEDVSTWIAVNDKIEPAVWLRSREVGHEVLSIDPAVDRIRRAMNQAVSRFYEDERMIANRTAQTSDALTEVGQSERSVDILTGMVDVADVSPDRKIYGDMCQHYLILRRNGEDRTQALEHVRAAYAHATPCAPSCRDIRQ
jgi:putative heme degradation protein